jgi:hypothetical protein
MTTTCYTCQKPITFWDNIPIDPTSMEPHRCVARVSSVKCRRCGFSITFNPRIKSKTGKLIPLENIHGNLRKHACGVWGILGM